jgi:prefoldin subunit 5
MITITLTEDEAISYINHLKIIQNLESQNKKYEKDIIDLQTCINNLKEANSSYNKEILTPISKELSVNTRVDRDVELAKSIQSHFKQSVNNTSTKTKFSTKKENKSNSASSNKHNKWEDGEIKALLYILNKSSKSIKHISYLKRKLNKNRTNNSIKSKLYRLGHLIDKEGYISCTNQEKYKSELSKLNIE